MQNSILGKNSFEIELQDPVRAATEALLALTELSSTFVKTSLHADKSFQETHNNSSLHKNILELKHLRVKLTHESLKNLDSKKDTVASLTKEAQTERSKFQGRKFLCTRDGCTSAFSSLVSLNEHTQNFHETKNLIQTELPTFDFLREGLTRSQTRQLMNLLNGDPQWSQITAASNSDTIETPLDVHPTFTRKRSRSISEDDDYRIKKKKKSLGKVLKKPSKNQNDTSETSLDEPVEKPSIERRFKCYHPGCKRVYAYRSGLTEHIQAVHDQTKFSCPWELCGVEFTKKGNLIRHIESIHMGMKYQCHVQGCHASFSQKGALSRHVKRHDSYADDFNWDEVDHTIRTESNRKQ